jgi:hypothetical protein
MSTPSRWCFIVGGVVYLLLGAVHAVLTLRDLHNPQTFTPPDPALRAAMQSSTVAIHPTANLWKAWLGFNLSHSVGVLLFGGFLITTGISSPGFASGFLVRVVIAVVAIVYVVLANVFWFRDPLVGTAIAATLIAATLFV